MISKIIEPGIDKAKSFDRIAELYYNHNFGSCTKSEIDLLMFRIYFEAAKEAAKDEYGFVDENRISDYKIGRALGLTPARVKSLRLKMELLYPEGDYDWTEEMEAVLAGKKSLNARNGQVEITIRSKNLMNAVQDWAEDQGDNVGLTFNSNVIILSVGSLLDLMDVVFKDENWKTVKKKLVKELKGTNTKEKLSTLLSGAVDVSAILANVTAAVNPASAVFAAISGVISVIKTIEEVQDK